MRIELSEQVADYIRSLPPEPRRALRLAIRGLKSGQGDCRALAGPLASYYRLRVANHRIIYAVHPDRISCIFAARRDVVYGLFEQIRMRDILE